MTTIDLTGCTFEDDSALSRAERAQARDRAAGKTCAPPSPYSILPDREQYEQRAVRDGTVVATRRVSRWGDRVSASDWLPA